MNNKGQTLVLFILVLPIIILIITCLIDMGSIIITKRQIENTVDLALTYGIKHINDSAIDVKLKKMIMKNNKEIEENNIIILIDDKLRITVKVNISSTILNREEILVIQKEIVIKK